MGISIVCAWNMVVTLWRPPLLQRLTFLKIHTLSPLLVIFLNGNRLAFGAPSLSQVSCLLLSQKMLHTLWAFYLPLVLARLEDKLKLSCFPRKFSHKMLTTLQFSSHSSTICRSVGTCLPTLEGNYFVLQSPHLISKHLSLFLGLSCWLLLILS